MTDANGLQNAAAELQKFRSSVAAADQLLSAGLYDDATSRLYYAVFHLASALLLTMGVEATSHRGLLNLFSQHVVRPGLASTDAGRVLTALFGLRNQADYNRYFLLNEEGAREERRRAQGVIERASRSPPRPRADSMTARTPAACLYPDPDRAPPRPAGAALGRHPRVPARFSGRREVSARAPGPATART
jgi:uncharacterized protein (UPF0332 family)